MTKNKHKPFVEWSFAQKRDEWMRQLAAVPEKVIPSGQKLVGFRIALYMREGQRRAFPSYDALGIACGISARMVQTHALTLKEKGWLDVSQQRAKGNQYWLRYDNFQTASFDGLDEEAETEA